MHANYGDAICKVYYYYKSLNGLLLQHPRANEFDQSARIGHMHLVGGLRHQQLIKHPYTQTPIKMPEPKILMQ